jgi:replicative DNA helicase
MRAVVESKKAEMLELGIELVAVIIDYAQRVKVKGKNGSRQQELGEAGREIKAMAMAMNVAVILPAQLNEDARKKGQRPNAENVREAQDLVMDSDNSIIIYAPYRDASVETDLSKAAKRAPEPVQFRLGKGRDGERGNVPGAFLPWITCFSAWLPEFTSQFGEYALPDDIKKEDEPDRKRR